MASKIQQDLDYFYKGLLSAQKILDKFSAEFSTKIDNVSQELDSLSSLTAGLRVVEDTPIAALVNGEIDKWQQIINICKGEAEKQVKGREFQDKFEKVPLVIVFGIVKAGKSTLGNFMHGRAFRDAPFDNVYKDGLLSRKKGGRTHRKKMRLTRTASNQRVQPSISHFLGWPGLTLPE